MNKFFLVVLLSCLLLAAPGAEAKEYTVGIEEYTGRMDDVLPLHAAVFMSSDNVARFGEDSAKYEGVAFPLYCGIASIFPKENKFVFTKMTDLPIVYVEEPLRKVEREGCIIDAHRIRVRVGQQEFYSALLALAQSRNFELSRISYGQKIPLDYKPRFTRICRYSNTKNPPTDCAYRTWDINDLFIPVTNEELTQTIDWPDR